MKIWSDDGGNRQGSPVARSLGCVVLLTGALLLLPAIGMQFTSEVNWGPGDFLVAGFLLIGTGSAYVLLARRVHSSRKRIAAASVLVLLLLTVWAELAVGLFA